VGGNYHRANLFREGRPEMGFIGGLLSSRHRLSAHYQDAQLNLLLWPQWLMVPDLNQTRLYPAGKFISEGKKYPFRLASSSLRR
jgi:hypothetical protein